MSYDSSINVWYDSFIPVKWHIIINQNTLVPNATKHLQQIQGIQFQCTEKTLTLQGQKMSHVQVLDNNMFCR